MRKQYLFYTFIMERNFEKYLIYNKKLRFYKWIEILKGVRSLSGFSQRVFNINSFTFAFIILKLTSSKLKSLFTIFCILLLKTNMYSRFIYLSNIGTCGRASLIFMLAIIWRVSSLWATVRCNFKIVFLLFVRNIF